MDTGKATLYIHLVNIFITRADVLNVKLNILLLVIHGGSHVRQGVTVRIKERTDRIVDWLRPELF
jgi:hypothetical protein